MSSCSLITAVVNTPIGPYDVSACHQGLHSVQLSSEVTDENFLDKGSSEIVLTYNNNNSCKDNNNILGQLENWMKIYFSGNVQKNFPEVKICRQVVDPDSDIFSNKILTTLMRQVCNYCLKSVTVPLNLLCSIK